MLISELKNEDGTYNHKKNFNIKKYIPFIEKKILCENIIDGCLETSENGLLICNNFMKKMLLDLKIIGTYTDIEFSENVVDDYDFLAENKIIDKIKESIDDSELDFIKSMVNKEIEQKIRIENSIENVLSQKLQQLIIKIPDQKGIKKIMNDIPKQINKIKPENLEILKGIIGNQNEGEVNG